MAEKSKEKNVNLLDRNSIKSVLDDSVSEVVKSEGYAENVRLSNVKLFMGSVVVIIALFAQFYNKKFPDNRYFLIGCVILYMAFSNLLQLIMYVKEKNVIMTTYPPEGSYSMTGLNISSKFSGTSDMYTLTIASADPTSISAKKPVHLTKSVTEWFTKDGILVEGLFWKDVKKLINDYAKQAPKKSK